jgi:hypothetical protein
LAPNAQSNPNEKEGFPLVSSIGARGLLVISKAYSDLGRSSACQIKASSMVPDAPCRSITTIGDQDKNTTNPFLKGLLMVVVQGNSPLEDYF